VITRLPSRGTILLSVAFILASILLTLYVWRSVGGKVPLQPMRYEVVALFDNASQLTPNADVRISGVTIGKVTTVRPQGLRTRATLAVESRFAPLPGDVRAILRQKTLLGESFVELSPGTAGAPRLAEGATIPRGQIAGTQPLDRVLGMLDRPTRARLHDLLTGSDTMLEGRGADLNASLGNLALGTRQLSATVRILDDQRGSLESLIRDTGTVLDTVAAQDADVRELVRSGHSALEATASRDAALTETVRRAPALLRELRATAVAAERTATLAGPVLEGFRPVAPLAAPTLRATADAMPQLRALLIDLDELLPTARRALPAAAEILRGLSGMMSAVEPAAAEVIPMIPYLASYRNELVATMANMSASTRATAPRSLGGRAPYLRTLIPMGSESAVGWESRLGGNRHAAYRKPGGLAGLADGLESGGCGHAEENGEAPPCVLQKGWSLDGGPERYFQHIGPEGGAGEAVAAVRRIARALAR
jgi:phospholipid/cholesterol/gamma-HCH transport system substrate-binding protein